MKVQRLTLLWYIRNEGVPQISKLFYDNWDKRQTDCGYSAWVRYADLILL
jgi:hypothetical protein